MDFLYENVNVYELINYYKDIYTYYQKNKQNVYNVLKGLTNQIIIEENDDNQEDGVDFSNFYFFYIQNIKPRIKRSNFRLVNVKDIEIKNSDDFLVGLNFSKCKIGSDIRIVLHGQNFKKKITRIILTEKNKNDIFLPVNNKEFYPFFLSNNNTKLIVQSDNKISEIDTIYLKLHRDYSTKFLNFATYLMNINNNTYIQFSNYNVKLLFENDRIIPNEFLFYWDLEKYYGRKIFNSIKKYKIKKYVKKFIEEEYNLYDDVSNTLCKFI